MRLKLVRPLTPPSTAASGSGCGGYLPNRSSYCLCRHAWYLTLLVEVPCKRAMPPRNGIAADQPANYRLKSHRMGLSMQVKASMQLPFVKQLSVAATLRTSSQRYWILTSGGRNAASLCFSTGWNLVRQFYPGLAFAAQGLGVPSPDAKRFVVLWCLEVVLRAPKNRQRLSDAVLTAGRHPWLNSFLSCRLGEAIGSYPHHHPTKNITAQTWLKFGNIISLVVYGFSL